MNHLAFLPEIVLLLATAIFIVAIFKRLNLSPVLGYLVAGAVVGENGLAYIDSTNLKVFAELGVVFLLFAIGLELTIDRLISMRLHVFGFGSAQFAITASLIGGLCLYFGLSTETSIIVGGSLALSSTAIVLRVLYDNNTQNTQVGRLALANLLLQDFAVVPLMVLVPILATKDGDIGILLGSTIGKTLIALVAIFFIGRMLLRPLFNMIASTKSNELFIAATLFVVLGTAFVTEILLLPLGLGAFIAGLLVAETQYQHKVEENIMPFKDLLMGLFFMAVGMTIDHNAIYQNLSLVLLLSLGLIAIKAGIIISLARIFRFPWGSSLQAGLLLSQGSEFAFILFNLAAIDYQLIPTEIAEMLLLVVTLTMALTPALSSIGTWVNKRMEKEHEKEQQDFSDVGDLSRHMVIIGFGKTGEIVANVLSSKKVSFVGLDPDAKRAKNGRDRGLPVYHGDPSKKSTLEAINISRAKAVIITIPDDVYLKKCVRMINQHYPDIPIVVRAEDLRNAKTLKKIGATMIVPERYEAGLQLAGALLNTVGITEFEVSQIKNKFRKHNYEIAKDMLTPDDEWYYGT